VGKLIITWSVSVILSAAISLASWSHKFIQTTYTHFSYFTKNSLLLHYKVKFIYTVREITDVSEVRVSTEGTAISVHRDVKPCRFIDMYWRSGMIFCLHLLSLRVEDAFCFTLKMEAAASTEMLSYRYQNVRRRFQGDIIHRSRYTGKHTKIRTTLCLWCCKAGGKSAGIDLFSVCLSGLEIKVEPLSELRQ
jgi:hypothetical protein